MPFRSFFVRAPRILQIIQEKISRIALNHHHHHPTTIHRIIIIIIIINIIIIIIIIIIITRDRYHEISLLLRTVLIYDVLLLKLLLIRLMEPVILYCTKIVIIRVHDRLVKSLVASARLTWCNMKIERSVNAVIIFYEHFLSLFTANHWDIWPRCSQFNRGN